MAWWGTLLGGTLGYLFGGPLGALLGAALGRNFDRGLQGTAAPGGGFSAGDRERTQAAFFTATFSVMGCIAKADGRVTRDEIRAAETIMERMQLDAAQRRAAMQLFNAGKQPDFDLHAVLLQFREECHRRRNLVRMFVEIQIATALADGHLHAGERRILYTIGEQLGFDRATIEQLFRFAGASASMDSGKSSLADAYEVLGVAPDASDAVVKKAYRRLMSQHHPDKLVSRGLPEEMIELATEKTREIRAAWELIRNSRA